MKKKAIFLVLAPFFLVLLLLSGCSYSGGSTAQNSSENKDEEMQSHTIAVLVYDRSDDEVVSFRKYLHDYIGEIFNVQFLYSDTITSGEEALAFIKDAAEYGAEGVMSFNIYDIEAEVALCAENKMYFMAASGTISDKAFASVEDNEYFVGVVGPGSFIEYKAGSDMAKNFISRKSGDEYFILSGGGCLGNEMHKLRTEGILDTLQNAYGVRFDIPSEEVAVSAEPVHLAAGDLTVHVSPGYPTFEEYYEMARTEYEAYPYKTVLSVLPAVKLSEIIKGAQTGVIDCYSESNLQLFTAGQLQYVCGKYSSIIGPSFAAMYNAITGHADAMRLNGKAFHITQGFWSSDSKEDYAEKYVLASSIERNAYNYEDLQKVMLSFNPEATLEDLSELAKHYTYKDAVNRRM